MNSFAYCSTRRTRRHRRSPSRCSSERPRRGPDIALRCPWTYAYLWWISGDSAPLSCPRAPRFGEPPLQLRRPHVPLRCQSTSQRRQCRARPHRWRRPCRSKPLSFALEAMDRSGEPQTTSMSLAAGRLPRCDVRGRGANGQFGDPGSDRQTARLRPNPPGSLPANVIRWVGDYRGAERRPPDCGPPGVWRWVTPEHRHFLDHRTVSTETEAHGLRRRT